MPGAEGVRPLWDGQDRPDAAARPGHRSPTDHGLSLPVVLNQVSGG